MLDARCLDAFFLSKMEGPRPPAYPPNPSFHEVSPIMAAAKKSTVEIIEGLNTAALKTDLPAMDVGDTVNVHTRIVEGDKERIQVFQGVVIAKAGRGSSAMITVRRIVEDMGVERVFPVHSPRVAKYEVVRKADARRAKLYYLRDRVGKSRRLRDKRRGLEKAISGGEAAAPAAAKA
jgi:large subunit ribosomal protein L19